MKFLWLSGFVEGLGWGGVYFAGKIGELWETVTVRI